MAGIQAFDKALTKPERDLMRRLSNPMKIQEFLSNLVYSTDDVYRSPLRVLRERTAMCFDGALFAAAALRFLGHPPKIIDMIPNRRDDDHILALYKLDNHWGAIAKSNFAGLQFREPVYRSVRELVMSYFEQYYNVAREKTLRAYTLPLSLKPFDRFNWMIDDAPLGRIADRLDKIRKIPVISKQMSRRLSLVDGRSYKAGLLGSVKKGLYRPPRRKPQR